MALSRFIFATFLITTKVLILQAQVPVVDTMDSQEGPHIQWVFQYPDRDSEKKSKFKERFVDLALGSNKKAQLVKPVAVTAADTNNFWIIDQENGTILMVKDQVGEITHFRNNDYKFFTSLVGICTLPGDKFLFTDSYLNKIFLFRKDKKELNDFSDTLALDRPTGIAYSSIYQQVWVAETNAHRIAILDDNGNLIKRIGHRGTAPGEFNFPTSIWIDDSGKVFIVDAMNFRIQVFSHEGDLLSVFGKAGDATGYFARPKGIATDSEGNIYVVDALFNTVQIFDMSGNFLYNFGSQGRDEGQFWLPSGIYIDDRDYIYIADTYNSRIQVFKYISGNGQ